MNGSVEDAIAQLEWLAEESPDAVRLARLVSSAARIEPHLLRRIRLQMMPEADVGVEADLWFSGLIESRGADAIVLEAGVAELLREALAAEPEALERATTITREAHRHLAPALRLEEELVALVLAGGDGVEDRIEEALRAAVRALTESAERAGEIARWVLRAWPRLPSRVRDTAAGATLALASSALLRRRTSPEPVTATATLEDVGWILPVVRADERHGFDVETTDGGLRFTRNARGALSLPVTDPLVVEIGWTSSGQERRRIAEVTDGGVVAIDADAMEVRIATLDGAEYELIPAGGVEAGASDDAGSRADAAAAAGEPRWADTSDAWMTRACVRVSVPGGKDEAAESAVRAGATEAVADRTGVWVTPFHVVTAGAGLADVEALFVESGLSDEPSRVVGGGGETGVLLLEVAGHGAFTDPVTLASPPFGATKVEGGDAFALEPRPALVLGFAEGQVRALAASAIVREFVAREFEVAMEGATRVPPTFVGGPVIMDGKVRGIVTGISVDPASDSTVLRVASAVVIRETIERTPSRASATQQVIEPEPAPAVGGHRFARVVVVGSPGSGRSALMRAIAGPPAGGGPEERRTIWWADAAGPPPLRAGIVLFRALNDEWWPLALDLEGAALVLIAVGADGGAGEARNWLSRDRSASVDVPVVFVATDTDPHAEAAAGILSELASIARQDGEGQRASRSPAAAAVHAEREAGLDVVRASVLERIDWARQADVAPAAFDRARRSSLAAFGAAEPFLGLKEWLDRVTSGPFAALEPLAAHAGVRVLGSAELVVLDPAAFEDAVRSITRLVRENADGVPASPSSAIEALGAAGNGPSRKAAQSEAPSRAPSRTGGPLSALYAGVAGELVRLGEARSVDTDAGPVLVMPRWLPHGQPAASVGKLSLRLSAEWRGGGIAVLAALAALYAFSNTSRVERVGWEPADRRGRMLADLGDAAELQLDVAEQGAFTTLEASTAGPPGTRDVHAAVSALRERLRELVPAEAGLTLRDEAGSAGTESRAL